MSPRIGIPLAFWEVTEHVCLDIHTRFLRPYVGGLFAAGRIKPAGLL
jgi:hypothetical protein